MSWSEVIARAKQGDESGYKYLYEQTYQKNYYVAFYYLKSNEAAQDVLQEAYIKAFNNLGQLQDAEKFPQWMSQIVTTKSIDELRKRKVVLFSQMESDENDQSVSEWFEDERTEVQPEVSMDQKETSRLVREMIDTLSEEQKICILSYYIEEMSVKEISNMLSVSENTVKSRLNYGRKKIQEKVMELEKNGTKLYGLAPIPFFLWLLHQDALTVSAQALPKQVISKINVDSKAADIAKIAAKTATGTAKATAIKIIAGIAAVAVVGGGAAAAYQINSAPETAEKHIQKEADENAENDKSENSLKQALQSAKDKSKTAETENMTEASAVQETERTNENETEKSAVQETESVTEQIAESENETAGEWFDAYLETESSAGVNNGWALLDVRGADVPLLVEMPELYSQNESEGITHSGIYNVLLFYYDENDGNVKQIENATSEDVNGALIDFYMSSGIGYYLRYLPDEKLLVGDLEGSSLVMETYEFDPQTGTLHTVDTYVDDAFDSVQSKDIVYYSNVEYLKDHIDDVAD